MTTPEGQPIKTSSRTSALTKPLRIRINDAAPADYAGWRNAEDKLKALGTALADLVEDDRQTSEQDAPKAGRKSDPEEVRVGFPTRRCLLTSRNATFLWFFPLDLPLVSLL
ncbi:hypothetical protein [Streptomyces pseudovenezuelae]|uniref:hypothetical protein n=1 Tax=Streptomyces pseudovenezuelae TaxID=67350 RepID=UPI002E7FE44C|nr:hypothetical protein [Streptomyces pseudovenezuelae]WUA85824.1 hypothetical protein OHO81_00210 [Streptomyces pseudovenezuelae]